MHIWAAEREELTWVLPDGTPAAEWQADGISLGAIAGRCERRIVRLATWGPCSRRAAVALFRRWYVESDGRGADLRQID